MRHPDCWPIKYFGEKKLHHSKVPRELIFGKLRSFYLFFKDKDFQEKSGKVTCSDNQIENQNKLSLQKSSKNVQNLQEIKKNHCQYEYMHWKLT